MTEASPPGPTPEPARRAFYSSAGVDVAAGERAVDLMKGHVARASRPEVLGSLGGFAGLFDASALTRFERPVLATSTDGVGTKVAIASAMGIHDTIGLDLVAMVVDDLVVCGAEPLFMTDYIACGSVVPERIAAIVSGIAAGAAKAGCALIGGETAEHPGLLRPEEYDVAGAATGVVEASRLLGPDRVRPGDKLIGMPSSGLHSNGYSLARHVLLGWAGWSLEREVPELGRELGAELLEPTRIYAGDCLALADALDRDLHAFAHVTGGGIAANLARILPTDTTAEVDRSTWHAQPIFGVIAAAGRVDERELEATFNMGLGMIAVVSADASERAIDLLGSRGCEAAVVGVVRERRPDDLGDGPAKGGTGGVAKLVGKFE